MSSFYLIFAFIKHSYIFFTKNGIILIKLLEKLDFLLKKLNEINFLIELSVYVLHSKCRATE